MSFTYATKYGSGLSMSKRSRDGNFKYTVKSKSGKKPNASKTLVLKRSRAAKLRQAAILGAVEHKYYDFGKALTTLTRPTDSSGLNVDPTQGGFPTPQEGDDSFSRDGRSITVDEIYIRGFVRFNGAEDQNFVPDGKIVRLLLYQDTQTNAAQCVSQDVVTNFMATSYLASSFMRNPNGWTRFNSIAEKCIECPPQPLAAVAGVQNDYSFSSNSVPFEIYHKFREPVKIRFNATNGGTIADIVDNSFHILASFGGDDAASTTNCVIAYNGRCRFWG